MILYAYFFWIWLLLTSFTQAADRASASMQCEEIKERSKEMYQRIRMMANEQLGLSSLLTLCHFEIEGWPLFVSTHQYCWDEQALKDLETALPAMRFKIKTRRSAEKPKGLDYNRAEINKLLLKRFNESVVTQPEDYFKKVPWKMYHVRGWPRGITFICKNWHFADILAIYHQLHQIEWQVVRKGEIRSVIYADGTVELFYPNKRRCEQQVAPDHFKRVKTETETEAEDSTAKSSNALDYELFDSDRFVHRSNNGFGVDIAINSNDLSFIDDFFTDIIGA